MADKVQYVNGGASFSSLLFLVFLTLKLCGVINWSWWLIFLPLYLPILIILVVIVSLLVSVGIFYFVTKPKK